MTANIQASSCVFKTTTPQSVSLHASFAEVALPFEPVEIQDPVIRCYLALNGPRYLLFDRDNASDDVFWALAPDLGTYTLDTPGYVIWDRWDLSRDTRALQPDDLILDVSEIEALEDGDVPETGTPLVITTKADNSDNYCIGPTSRYESDPDITPETAAMIEAELNGTPRNPGEGGSGGGAVGGDASEGDEPGCQVASSDRSGAAIPMILLGIFGALGWSRRRRRR